MLYLTKVEIVAQELIGIIWLILEAQIILSKQETACSILGIQRTDGTCAILLHIVMYSDYALRIGRIFLTTSNNIHLIVLFPSSAALRRFC